METPLVSRDGNSTGYLLPDGWTTAMEGSDLFFAVVSGLLLLVILLGILVSFL